MAIKPHTRRDTTTANPTDLVPLGCLDVETPNGDYHCHDAPGMMTIAIKRPGIPATIGVLTYGPSSPIGHICQLDGPGARAIAASLWALADEIDPKGGVQ